MLFTLQCILEAFLFWNWCKKTKGLSTRAFETWKYNVSYCQNCQAAWLVSRQGSGGIMGRRSCPSRNPRRTFFCSAGQVGLSWLHYTKGCLLLPVFSLGKQLRSGILAYFNAPFMQEHARPPLSLGPCMAQAPIPAKATIPALPQIPAGPSWPAPAKSCPATAIEFFLQYQFFPWTYCFFPHVREKFSNKGKNTKWANSAYCVEETLPAAPRSTARCAQASCWAAAFCVCTLLYKSLQLPQISMLTLTVTWSGGSTMQNLLLRSHHVFRVM